MRLFFWLALFLYLALVQPLLATAAEPLAATAVIRGDEDGGRISRHIYGHFAEHLGRCIYDGIWVGEDSAIANTRGMRTDVL